MISVYTHTACSYRLAGAIKFRLEHSDAPTERLFASGNNLHFALLFSRECRNSLTLSGGTRLMHCSAVARAKFKQT